MKTVIIRLLSLMLLMPFITIAQPGQNCCENIDCCQSKTIKPSITKGYYAIGNNAQKLARTGTLPDCCLNDSARANADAPDRPAKGYYAIGNNAGKLQASPGKIVIGNTPPVQKGYYAIGKNAEKLQRQSKQGAGCCDCCAK